VKDARQAFGVTLAISGSIQRLPSTLRLTLNLVDANALAQIGSRTIDLATSRELVTQDTVISAATTLLALELEPVAKKALTAGGTAAPGAYELYVQGRGYLQRFESRRRQHRSRCRCVSAAAIAMDSNYALAHTALGETYWRKYEATKKWPGSTGPCSSARPRWPSTRRIAPVHVTLAMIRPGPRPLRRGDRRRATRGRARPGQQRCLS
jgi:hypothetical protein